MAKGLAVDRDEGLGVVFYEGGRLLEYNGNDVEVRIENSDNGNGEEISVGVYY